MYFALKELQKLYIFRTVIKISQGLQLQRGVSFLYRCFHLFDDGSCSLPRTSGITFSVADFIIINVFKHCLLSSVYYEINSVGLVILCSHLFWATL